MSSGRNLATALAFLLSLGLAASGCGASSGGGESSPHPNYERALVGSPAPLAAIHAQANELLPGGVDAYEARLAELKGYPAVVNVWASWCGPCRFEFPALQRLSARYGKQVAFLGVNSQDSEDNAAAYLEEEPVPYPSYSDGDERIAESIGASRGLPDTAFYDSGGELCFLKQGPYTDDEDLEADIRRFALRGECENG